MPLTDRLNKPGIHPVIMQGDAGALEVELTVPEAAKPGIIALLGHPHSLQGGSMNNKVVTTLVRVFSDLHVASIRFNFRGVGQSAGTYDAGIGESDDMLMLARHCLEAHPDTIILFAGFSFGSYVAYRAAAQCNHGLLITIAPSVLHYNYTEFPKVPSPWIVLQGEEDEIVPASRVIDFAMQCSPPLTLVRFEGTGHFFHGKLLELRARLIDSIRDKVVFL